MNSGVKVQYFSLRCNGVEVQVLKFGNTQVKYKFLKSVLKGRLHHFSTFLHIIGPH